PMLPVYNHEAPARGCPRRHSLHFHFPLFCPRNPMEKLHRKTFSFHFRNLEFAYGRNCSYLCYQVEGRLSGSPGLSEQGVFVNEVWPGRHSPHRQDSGAQLAIMFFWDFRYCWDNFVHNSGRPFIPWKKINVNSDLLATKLEDILNEVCRID
uniref:Uncharacterized protein n=1 Tax=Equus asinus TaxID=9793 RepID=A0A9L0IVB3_EQUAS